MARFCTVALAAVFVLASLAHAEVGVQPSASAASAVGQDGGSSLVLKPQASFGGLFDSHRISFQHTVGINFQSGTYGGANQYYVNTITYKAAEPLTIQAQVGIENNLYGSPAFGSSGNGSVRLIVPHLGVFYQPRPNIRISVEFSSLPYSGYGSYRP